MRGRPNLYTDYSKESAIFSNNTQKVWFTFVIVFAISMCFLASEYWLLLLTTALLFYHMSRVNSIKASPKLAAFVAASLVIISTLYMLYSLAPYIDRMNHVIRKCKRNKICSNNHLNIIISERNSYVILGILTSIIQIIITWLIVSKEFK